MMLNATFNNISAIPWQSVLLVEEIGVLGENYQPVASYWHTLSHKVKLSTRRQSLNSDGQHFHQYKQNKMGFINVSY